MTYAILAKGTLRETASQGATLGESSARQRRGTPAPRPPLNVASPLLLAITLALALALLASPRGSANAAPGSSSHVDVHARDTSTVAAVHEADAMARYLRTQRGLSKAESNRRIDRQPEFLAFVDRIREMKGGQWGGFWIDHEYGGRLHLAATQWTDGDIELLRRDFPWPDLLEMETVPHPLTALTEAFDHAFKERAQLRRLGFPHYEMSVDVAGNRLTFHSDEFSEDQKATLRARHRVPVSFAPEEAPATPDCFTSRKCDPPLRGGIRLETSTGARRGAGGFVVRNPAGTWYLVAAGHAWSTGEVAYQPTNSLGRRRIGGVPASVTAGRVDAARVYVEDPAFWSPTRWIWVEDSAQAYAITSRNDSAENAAPGVLLCRAGGHTGTYCGEVLRTFATSTRGGVEYTRQLRTNICSSTGDSGSPVFSRQASGSHPAGRAFAIHAASNASQYPCGHPGFRAYSSHIEYVQDELEVRVWIH